MEKFASQQFSNAGEWKLFFSPSHWKKNPRYVFVKIDIVWVEYYAIFFI